MEPGEDGLDERQRARAEAYKKGIDVDDARRKRTEAAVSVRKNKRSEQLKKRRQVSVFEDEFGGQEEIFPLAANDQRLDRMVAMLERLRTGELNEQLDVMTWFRKQLSLEQNPPIDLVIQCGAVHYFVQFLTRHDSPQLQFEAAWALTNIASGQSHQTRAVVAHQAVPQLVNLVTSGTDDVEEQAVWCLGNVAGDSSTCRDYVLSRNIMAPLLSNLTPASRVSMLRNATWTLSNLCRGKPPAAWESVAPGLMTLSRLIYSTDVEVLTDALWALSYLSDGTEDRIQHVIDAGVCSRVVELLTHPSPSVQVPALRTVGNIVTGTDAQTQTIMNCAVLGCMHHLLGSQKENIRKEACWTLSNITAGNKQQILAVIEAKLIPPIIEILDKSEFVKTKKEAAWAISNMTVGGSAEHIRYLVQEGAIKPLCDLLLVQEPRMVLVALTGLENILRVGKADAAVLGHNVYAQLVDHALGVEKIDLLQDHANQEIYKKAMHILQTYFEAEEATDAAVAPQATANQFLFQAGVAMPRDGFHLS